MAHATLDALLVSQACARTLAVHSLVDSNTAIRKIVERLRALSSAAATNLGPPQYVTLTDDEFAMIAPHWDTSAIATPAITGPTERRRVQVPLGHVERRKRA